jgi:hypothetical protein
MFIDISEGRAVTLKMETVPSSETSIHIYQSIRRYIPEDSQFKPIAVRTTDPIKLG